MLDIKEIMAILPHRYPMLLVDRINQCEDGKVLAHKNVSYNESFFQGHYPGHPIMPGVLIVEAMMQTSAVLFRNRLVKGTPLVVTSIDNVKFRRPVVPGDRLDIEVTLLRSPGPLRPLRRNSLRRGQRGLLGRVFAGVPESQNSPQRKRMIHATAIVDSRAEIADDCEIGPYVVIGEGVSIDSGTSVGSHTVIEGRTRNRQEKPHLAPRRPRHGSAGSQVQRQPDHS